MNYIAEIKAFYDLVQVKQLSTGQIALWNALMYINNKCAWIEWFTVPNILLELNTGMSRSGVLKARNSLKQYGLIDFKANGTKATIYKINTIAKSTQDSNQVGVQGSTQDGVQDGKQGGNTLTKLNETKHIEENIKKKSYGENGNVKFTDEEYEKVKAYFPNDYSERIQALDDYIQSKGKRYKDFFATLRTWARKEGYKPPPKETQPTEEVKAIDTSQLTPEEYGKLLKGEITMQELIQKGKIYV